MSNIVTKLLEKQSRTFSSLNTGDMFQYSGGSSNNIYIKTSILNAISLNTGDVYTPSGYTEVQPVAEVNIKNNG